MTERLSDIDRDVFQHEIIAAAEEMSAVLRRSAFSPIIWDMIDYACGILDPEGNMVAQAPTIPAQLGIMPMAFRETVKAIPLSEWRAGDVVVCNDPYAGCTHTPDIVMFAPVFADGALVAIASSIAHHIDVGGRVPGTESATAVEIYEEGLLIPPLKAIDQGRRNETFFKIFARNVRDPHASLGDLDAQMAACNVGARSIVRLIEKYGIPGFALRCGAIADYAETVLTRVLLGYEGAQAEATVLMEDDAASEEPMQLRVGVAIRNGRIALDFSGTSDQRQNGLNNPIASTISMVCYAVKVVFTPDLPQNEGFNRSLSISVPEGSILNPRAPAAVSVRHLTQQAVADVVLKALAEIAPDKSIAGTQISFPTFVVGGLDTRAAAVGQAPYFVTCDIIGGGMGASQFGPGLDAVDTHGGNCALLSAEVMELTAPVRVTRTTLIADSGGGGQHRGGAAIEREYEMLCDGLSLSGYLQQTRAETAPWGLAGGDPGAPGKATLETNGTGPKPIPSKFVAIRVDKGDRLVLRSAGGGGWGRAK
ncbi:hydantoinase B/oxoprolinase family protein [Dongia sp. agr-C8]